MNPRAFLIPTLAVLAGVALPVLAQYPNMKAPSPPAQPPAVPMATPAPAPAAPAVAAPATQPGSATETPLPPVAHHNCVAPEYPGRNGSNIQVSVFNKEYKAYNECIRKYIDTNRESVRAIEEANNKAVDEYNKFTENLKKEIDASREN